ncbi:hypothetical protein L1049_028540 [Liquidambar formosana]|uniref:Homeobox protein knotted-1-like 6 n=1 Tax=Liquidambar formosana TaxID=63359 RepID=A0AAP0RKC8_LIQFO
MVKKGGRRPHGLPGLPLRLRGQLLDNLNTHTFLLRWFSPSAPRSVSGASEEREIKDKLLRKYSGYISTLKQEFSKKKKKGKLPKEARQTLLDWWNIHYKWPYPTEADKVALAESTGLDQKQINNWFINQRKRHWKPSENMQFAVMDSLYGPFFMND